MISVRGDAVVIEYDRPALDASLANDPRKYQVFRFCLPRPNFVLCCLILSMYRSFILSFDSILSQGLAVAFCCAVPFRV